MKKDLFAIICKNKQVNKLYFWPDKLYLPKLQEITLEFGL